MSKLKIVITGCYQSHSGYGVHARTVLRALKAVEDKIDLYVLPLSFAQTSNTYSGPDLEWFQYLTSKFNPEMLNSPGFFDISIQTGIPTEWKNFAKYNIGLTAGIETLSIPPEWIQPCNNMNKIITISEFSKRSFINTLIEGNSVKTPIDVCSYPIRDIENYEALGLKITTSFNFLSINQFAPRKNIPNMLHWFIQEFKDNEDVGLVLKIFMQNNSTPDYYATRLQIFDILKQYQDKKCKVYFLHGDLTDAQINSLYNDPKIKVYVSAQHSEGWGLSLFDAACMAMPVVTTDFGGHKDYLYQNKKDDKGKLKLRPFYQKVNFDINPIQPEHHMPGLLNPGQLWAYPHEKDFKLKLREVYKDYGRFKKQAKELKDILKEKYSVENVYTSYLNSIFSDFILETQEDEVIEVI